MNKSKTSWLMIALVFILIMLGAFCSFSNKASLRALKQPPSIESSVQNSQSAEELININTASKEELKELGGIDKGKAQAIIDYRKEHGNFISVDEILRVDGIGTKTYIKIKDKICV